MGGGGYKLALDQWHWQKSLMVALEQWNSEDPISKVKKGIKCIWHAVFMLMDEISRSCKSQKRVSNRVAGSKRPIRWKSIELAETYQFNSPKDDLDDLQDSVRMFRQDGGLADRLSGTVIKSYFSNADTSGEKMSGSTGGKEGGLIFSSGDDQDVVELEQMELNRARKIRRRHSQKLPLHLRPWDASPDDIGGIVQYRRQSFG